MVHTKRITLSKSIKVPRKLTKWITRPRQGTHKVSEAISINTLLKEYLNITKTTKETKFILNQGKVKIDGKVRKDVKFPVGLMDVVSIEDIKKHYRIMYDNLGRVLPLEITKEEASLKPRKIINKTIIRGKKTQINLGDGINLLKEAKDYKVNDTLVFDLNDNKIKHHLKLEKGAIAYITDGSKKGLFGKVKEINDTKGMQVNTITLVHDKDEFQTKKDYAFIIGKTKSEIKLPQ